MKTVTCVGAVTVDHVFRVRKIPTAIDEQLVCNEYIGGRAVTVALDLIREGVNVELVGAVGEDFGRHQEFLKNMGVGLKGLIRCRNVVCDQVFMYVNKKSLEEKIFFRSNGVHFGKFYNKHLNLIAQSDLVYFSCWDTDFAYKALKTAFEIGKPIVQNFTFEISFARKYIADTLHRCTVAVMNEKEFEILNTIVAGGIRGWFAENNHLKWVVVTNSSQGSKGWERQGGDVKKYAVNSALVSQTCNTMGAGDAYASGLIIGMLSGWDLRRSMLLGSKQGARAVSSEAGYII